MKTNTHTHTDDKPIFTEPEMSGLVAREQRLIPRFQEADLEELVVTHLADFLVDVPVVIVHSEVVIFGVFGKL